MSPEPPSEPSPRGPEPSSPSRKPAQATPPAARVAELEERLRNAQRMAAVGRLAAAVAHDFNNIIQAVMGYTSFALEELPEDAPARSDLEHVLNASSRGATLVRQLLVLARREHGELGCVDASEIVNDLSKLLRRAVGESIEFAVELDAPPHDVIVDRAQLEQALVTLVLRAREALSSSGRIRLRVCRVRSARSGVRADAPGDEYVEVSVANSSYGANAAAPTRDLEPGQPANAAGNLDLLEVSRFAERHGGFVTSSSAPDVGEVRICLPRVTAGSGGGGHFVEAEPRASGAIVLLAEDDEQIRRIAQRSLEKAGFSVIPAADGEQALRLFDAQPAAVSVALIDVIMPKLSGTALVEELRRRRPDLPVVLTSGYSFGQLGSEPGERTVLIAKPYSPKAMVERVRELVDRFVAVAR